jgi:putative oligomerization/nucleic acid binding protein
MFGRRRRPLVRAAAVGGAGYAIGKRRARNQADDAYEEGYDEAAAEDPGLDAGAMNDLEKLAELKDKGVLTQEEFDQQKAKILGT